MNTSIKQVMATSAALAGALAGLSVGVAGSAQAATVRPSASCSSDPTQSATTLISRPDGGATIELRYSTTCRTVWARIEGGKVGDYMWVYNENTGAEEKAHINSGTSNYTAAIGDAGTKSDACMMQVGTTTIVCTPYE